MAATAFPSNLSLRLRVRFEPGLTENGVRSPCFNERECINVVTVRLAMPGGRTPHPLSCCHVHLPITYPVIPPAKSATIPSASDTPSARARGSSDRPSSISAHNSPSNKATGAHSAARNEALLGGQTELAPEELPAHVEKEARRLALLMSARRAQIVERDASGKPPREWHRVDVNSVKTIRSRTVGVEHVGRRAMEELALPELFEKVGMGRGMRHAATGSIIGRLAEPPRINWKLPADWTNSWSATSRRWPLCSSAWPATCC